MALIEPGKGLRSDIDLLAAWRFLQARLRFIETSIRAIDALLTKYRVDRPRLIFAIFSLCLLVQLADGPVVPHGDYGDYHGTLAALRNHGTVDLRPGDLEGVPKGVWMMWITSPVDGRQYNYHFVAYSALAVPVSFVLQAVGADWLATFKVLNGLLLLAALYAVALLSPRPWYGRFVYGIAFAGPATWYLGWPGPELYSFALVTIALVSADRRQFGWAAALAAIASWQNTPIVLLAALMVLFSLRERKLATTARSLAASSLVFVPFLLNWHWMGNPLFFVKSHAFDNSLIGLPRLSSLFLDLNQGMLPYVPGLLLATLWALVDGVRGRDFRVPAAFAVLIAMAALCCSTTNWNSGCMFIMRYCVWMLPLMAWMISAAPSLQHRRFQWGLAVLMLWQINIGNNLPPVAKSVIRHTETARWAFAHAPALYNPDPQIFAMRTLKRHPQDNEQIYPLVFEDGGSAQKILTDVVGLDRLEKRFHVDPKWLNQVKTDNANRSGAFYLNPPRGAVVLRR